LFAFSIEGLELVSGYLKDIPLVSFLEAWYKRDKNLYSSFIAHMSYFTKGLPDHRNLQLWSVFERLMKEATEMLFGPGGRV
jgi:hypothetical protein